MRWRCFRTDGGPAYTLFVQPRERGGLKTWTGYRPGLEGAREGGLRRGRGLPDCLDLIDRSCSPSSIKECPAPSTTPSAAEPDLDRKLDRNPGADFRRQSPRRASPPHRADPRSRVSILHEMRLFKNEADELEIMRRCRRTSACEAHHRGGPNRSARPHGVRAFERRARTTSSGKRGGGDGPAYGSASWAGGAGAAVLHYVSNDQQAGRRVETWC